MTEIEEALPSMEQMLGDMARQENHVELYFHEGNWSCFSGKLKQHGGKSEELFDAITKCHDEMMNFYNDEYRNEEENKPQGS